MVYQRASESLGAVSSRISLRAEGAISAMPISSKDSISPLCRCCVSSMEKELAADNVTHHRTEEVVKEADKKRNQERNADDHEGVRVRRPTAWPDDLRELFAHMLQVGEG